MPKYLLKASYTGEGTRGLMKEGGTARRAAVDKLITSLGGKMETFYYTFGDSDAVVIFDAPSNTVAAAGSLIANSTGLVSVTITPLLTVEEVDAASKMTGQYRAPGQ